MKNGKGGAWVGCVACHAYAQERPQKVQANPYADFIIGATKLLLETGKPHVLLRHAKTQLHLQAVAAMLDVPCGAQVNITSKYRWPPRRACASRCDAHARRVLLTTISARIPWGRSFRLGRPSS